MSRCPIPTCRNPTDNLAQHLQLHDNDPNFEILCTYPQCLGTEPYRNYNDFMDHIENHRREIRNQQLPNIQAEEENQAMELDYHNDIDFDFDNDNDDHVPAHPLPPNHPPNHPNGLYPDVVQQQLLQRAQFENPMDEAQYAAIYHMYRLKEEKITTETTLEAMINTIEHLFTFLQNSIEQKILDAFDNFHGIPREEFEAHLNNNNIWIDSVFEGLNTPHLRKVYLANHFYPITPKKVLMGTVEVNTPDEVLITEKYGYTVSFKQSIGRMMRNPYILCHIGVDYSSTDGILRDECDGSNCKNHPILQQHRDAIKVRIYYDDVELTTPIGSKKVSMGMFYYSIVNIPPKYRSKIKTIQLLAIAKKEDIKDYGLEDLLKEFFLDLEHFRLGVQIEVMPNVFRVFYVAVIGVSGDTLGQQYLGGFKEGVALAQKICRQCFGTLEDAQNNHRESLFVLRHLPQHNQLVDQLEGLNGEEARIFSRDNGINGRSILQEKIPGFDVTKNLTQDWMHVMDEGPVAYEIHLFLKYCLQNGFFTLEILNERIELFDFGFAEISNRISPITQNHINSLSNELPGQNASQMWLLARCIIFLIDDLVHDDDPHKQSLCDHIRLLYIATAPEIHPTTPNLFADLIEQHQLLFKQVYPENRLTPKFHYYIHLPSTMKREGPLKLIGTMRFEAKHKYFKNLAKIANWKNIGKTLSERHELYQALLNALPPGDEPIVNFMDDNEWDTGEEIFNHIVDEIRNLFPDTVDTPFYCCKWAILNGTKFKILKSVARILNDPGDELPTYVFISSIITNRRRTFFVGRNIVINDYSTKFNAYEIERIENEDDIMIPSSQCSNLHSLAIWKPFNSNISYIADRTLDHSIFN